MEIFCFVNEALIPKVGQVHKFAGSSISKQSYLTVVIINYALDNHFGCMNVSYIKLEFYIFHRCFRLRGDLVSFPFFFPVRTDWPRFRISPHSFNSSRATKRGDAITAGPISCFHIMAIKVGRTSPIISRADNGNAIVITILEHYLPVSGTIERYFWVRRARCRTKLCGAFVCTARMHLVY